MPITSDSFIGCCIVLFMTQCALPAHAFQNRAVRRKTTTCTGPFLSSSEHQAATESSPTGVAPDPNAVGLYQTFSSHASEKLLGSGWFQEMKVPEKLALNQSPAKGMKNSIVRISTRAMVPTTRNEDLVQYARITLLETVPAVAAGGGGGDGALDDASSSTIYVEGIQVLNFVVLPGKGTTLPVLGIDLVSLPGGRHLLLMDAQPMVISEQKNLPWDDHWKDWYSQHVDGNSDKFPWGGDFPEAVQPFVSKHSLWTRLQEVENPTDVIQRDVWEAFVDHLDAYLDLLGQYEGEEISAVLGDNNQTAYLNYRRGTDPAKPMLNSLYGAEWTDQLLEEVLFPK
jgi:hypothetical protein